MWSNRGQEWHIGATHASRTTQRNAKRMMDFGKRTLVETQRWLRRDRSGSFGWPLNAQRQENVIAVPESRPSPLWRGDSVPSRSEPNGPSLRKSCRPRIAKPAAYRNCWPSTDPAAGPVSRPRQADRARTSMYASQSAFIAQVSHEEPIQSTHPSATRGCRARPDSLPTGRDESDGDQPDGQ